MSKTHCKNGHERTPDNVNKWRGCIRCQRKGTGAQRGLKLSPERKALLAAAVADGWPIRQIIATYGIGTATVKKHYPDYHGLPQNEAITLTLAERNLCARVDTYRRAG